MPTIKIADKPTLDRVAEGVDDLVNRTPFDLDSYMYYFGGLKTTNPGDDVYNWLMRTASIVDAPGVTKLARYALYGFSNLTSVNIPDALTIETSSLTSCPLLSTLRAPKVESISQYCIDLTSMRTLCFPSLTTLPIQWFYTQGTEKLLTHVYLGNIANYDKQIFEDVANQKYIMMNHPERISAGLFGGKTANAKLILLGDNVCALAAVSYANAYAEVYVRASVYDDYIVATNWSQIASKIHRIEDSQEILDAIAEMGVEYSA